MPPNNFQVPSINPPGSREDIPPALPHRPNYLGNSPILPPKSQTNRLYPSLEDEFQHNTSPPPALVKMALKTIVQAKDLRTLSDKVMVKRFSSKKLFFLQLASFYTNLKNKYGSKSSCKRIFAYDDQV